MKNEFTPWPRVALAYPHDVELAAEPALACMAPTGDGPYVMPTCDRGIEIAQTFGGTGVANIGVAAYISTATPSRGRRVPKPLAVMGVKI